MQCDFQKQLRDLGARIPCAVKQLEALKSPSPEANVTTTLTS